MHDCGAAIRIGLAERVMRPSWSSSCGGINVYFATGLYFVHRQALICSPSPEMATLEWQIFTRRLTEIKVPISHVNP